MTVRPARREDLPAIQRIRAAVRENRLVSRTIPDAEVIEHMEELGRGFVAEEAGEVVGFAIGRRTDGNVWALFIHPDHESRGHGRRLFDELIAWMWSTGLERVWLTTESGTRAESFYRSAGWTEVGMTPDDELHFELRRVDAGSVFRWSEIRRFEVYAALIMGLLIPIFETSRRGFDHWWVHFGTMFEDHLAGALLVVAAFTALRPRPWSNAVLLGAWCYVTGMMSSSFWYQVEAELSGQSLESGHEIVLIAKAIAWGTCLLSVGLSFRQLSRQMGRIA